ncbi:hypothetical protein PP707_03775 [Acetobacter pasteurianus]|nr:hypothetical protein [Acetobacter pasteurianus]
MESSPLLLSKEPHPHPPPPPPPHPPPRPLFTAITFLLFTPFVTSNYNLRIVI